MSSSSFLSNEQAYDVIFAVFLSLAAFVTPKYLGMILQYLILLFPLFSLGIAIYLSFLSQTWSTDPLSSDADKYQRAVRRSSVFFLFLSVLNLVFPLIRQFIKKESFTRSLGYKYVTLYVVMIAAYVFDRAVSLDEGLQITLNDPWRGIKLAFDSICSPSFMRFFFVLVIEIMLVIILDLVILPMIPVQNKLVKHTLGSLIIPFLVFTIVTGPLRFRWAYPNVSYVERISYISAYTICFLLVGLISYVCRGGLFLLLTLIVLAGLLQFGGYSNTTPDYSLVKEVGFDDPSAFVLAFITLVAVLVYGWTQFKHSVAKYIPS